MKLLKKLFRSHPLVPALILLSICDSLQLLFSIFVLYVPALHDHLEMDQKGWMAQIAYIATGGLAGGLLASNCASIWTMCYISIQRHQAIVQPFTTVSSSNNGNLTLFGIAFFAIIFNIPVWYTFRINKFILKIGLNLVGMFPRIEIN